MKRHLLALVTLLSAGLLAAQPSYPLEGLPNYYWLRPNIKDYVAQNKPD